MNLQHSCDQCSSRFRSLKDVSQHTADAHPVGRPGVLLGDCGAPGLTPDTAVGCFHIFPGALIDTFTKDLLSGRVWSRANYSYHALPSGYYILGHDRHGVVNQKFFPTHLLAQVPKDTPQGRFWCLVSITWDDTRVSLGVHLHDGCLRTRNLTSVEGLGVALGELQQKPNSFWEGSGVKDRHLSSTSWKPPRSCKRVTIP